MLLAFLNHCLEEKDWLFTHGTGELKLGVFPKYLGQAVGEHDEDLAEHGFWGH